MAPPVLVTFRAGEVGRWRVERADVLAGDALPGAARIEVGPGGAPLMSPPAWTLRGFTSNDRYVARPERIALSAVQQPLGRLQATSAALIPIRKSEAWWDLPQDERRAVLEERSHHIAVGLEYLPAVARRLHHCRDLGEPFDFLTWFEFAPEASGAFDELLSRLRETPEWAYVDREVDIRLSRAT